MDWWTGDADMSWLGSMTTWWIVGPLAAVLVLWVVLKISQRPHGQSRNAV
jgi:hypothetical protein